MGMNVSNHAILVRIAIIMESVVHRVKYGAEVVALPDRSSPADNAAVPVRLMGVAFAKTRAFLVKYRILTKTEHVFARATHREA